MKILVMGSGGVGGYFGGRLAGAGNDVTFVARGAHLAAMQKDGLVLDSQVGNLTVKPVKATADPTTAGVPDIVIFATKMGDTEGAARQLAPIAKKGVTIVTPVSEAPGGWSADFLDPDGFGLGLYQSEDKPRTLKS